MAKAKTTAERPAKEKTYEEYSEAMAGDADEDPSKFENVRRVYALPAEMVDRIVAFQKENGFSSEVEAARRLIDEALKYRDDAHSIRKRFQERLKTTKLMSDIARDILMGHPLVKKIEIENDRIMFTLSSGDSVTIHKDGQAHYESAEGGRMDYDEEGRAEQPF